MQRYLGIAMVAAMTVGALWGCNSTKRACEETWDHLAPLYGGPDDYANENSYASMLQAAFMEACPTDLSENERTCLQKLEKRKNLWKDCESAAIKIMNKEQEIRKARDSAAKE